jgi:pilus assembly protein CpaB
MARIRILLVFALALTAGGVLAFGTYNYVQQQAPAAGVPMQTQKVVVAAADLDIGAELAEKDVRIIEWPAGAVPKNVFSDPNEVIGRGLIVSVVENEPFLPMKLASKEAGSGLPPAIPPGLRAVSVRVNEVIGVSGYVMPGTRVDVVVTLSPTQQAQDMTSKVILTDVLVLAAGTKMERDTKDQPVAVSVVTLLVNPEESERLTLAANEGKIQLALRNPLDRANPATTGVRPAMLLGTAPPIRQVARPRASPPPASKPGGMSVEIIRGDKRAHEPVREQE